MTVVERARLKQSRRRWTEGLGEAQWWLAEAIKSARGGDYKKSRSETMMACHLLDNACQFETEAPQ